MAFLDIRDVSVQFRLPGRGRRVLRAVDGVSLQVSQGQTLGLVGESGCGKSTLARACTMLVPLTGGRIVLDGVCLNDLSWSELRRARGDFQMVFQDPYASLDPRMTIFDTLAEAIRVRRPLRGRALAGRIQELLAAVGLAPVHARHYPHEFSGGQRQRIAVARALATEPRLVVADEPVSALDVSVQSQIINLIRRLCQAADLTMIFISHDLSVVHHVADRIAVMYLGRIVELGDAREVIAQPLHPYTRALVSAVPEVDPGAARRQRIVLSGDPPSPITPPSGCRFHTRCPFAVEICAQTAPELVAAEEGRFVSCLRLNAVQQEADRRVPGSQ